MYKHFVKRGLDFLLSLCGIIVLSPVLAALWVLVRVKLGSPVLFVQPRPGMVDPRTGRERIFRMYKFRSMSDARDEKGELLPDEVRLGKFGKWLRATSLDELPEAFNILKGDMSLVGTRPPTLDEYQQYSYYQKRRISFRPGITGLWQISGRSEIVDFDEVVKLDLEYIDNWSLLLDIKIILKTILLVFRGSGAR